MQRDGQNAGHGAQADNTNDEQPKYQRVNGARHIEYAAGKPCNRHRRVHVFGREESKRRAEDGGEQ